MIYRPIKLNKLNPNQMSTTATAKSQHFLLNIATDEPDSRVKSGG